VLRLQHAEVFSEMDRLKAVLIELADDASDGFREVFVAGQVTVAGPHSGEFKGHVPEVDSKIFDVLSEAKRKKLIDAGVIKIAPHSTRDFRPRGATLDGHSTPATRGRRTTLSDNLDCDEKDGPVPQKGKH